MDEERSRGGRPRSEQARTAVLHAVDDLLLEVGYAAMTMKSIAERAGVSRMTVYRWWSTKAEILLEATATDADEELTVEPTGDPLADLTSYLEALVRFLANSPAGVAYRALLGEAQHDPVVAELLSARDVLGRSARAALRRSTGAASDDVDTALLIGPVLYWVLTGRNPDSLDPRTLATAFLGSRVRSAP